MDEVRTVPLWQQIAAHVSRALLAVYLLGAVALAVAVATGRATLSPLGAAYLVLPAILFVQAVVNTARSRRAGDSRRRHELARNGGVQAAMGVVLTGQLAYYWWVAPQTFWLAQ